MAHFFRGSGLGALLPTAAAGAFVARSLAKRAAPAAMVLRATALPRSACAGARRRTVWAIRVGDEVERGRREGGRGRHARARFLMRPTSNLRIFTQKFASLFDAASLNMHPTQAFSTAADAAAAADGAAADAPAPSVTAPFHLAIPVADLAAAREFYGRCESVHLEKASASRAGEIKKSRGPSQKTTPFTFSKLGCPEGRSASTWVDYSLYGHQLVCHVVPGYSAAASANAVDGDPVPVPHFGLCLTVPQFHDLAARVKAAGVQFVIEPHLRWPGQPGEQWTMFFKVRREREWWLSV